MPPFDHTPVDLSIHHPPDANFNSLLAAIRRGTARAKTGSSHSVRSAGQSVTPVPVRTGRNAALASLRVRTDGAPASNEGLRDGK